MNEIVSFVPANPVTVLTDEKQYSEFYKRIKEEISSHVPSVATVMGRKAIASLAYKVVRTKTAIDDAGKELNEEARAKINAVDAQRRKIRDELDALAAEVRKPLTEWEQAEEAKAEIVNSFNRRLKELLLIPHGAASQYIADTLAELTGLEINPEIFGEVEDAARANLDSAVDQVRSMLERTKKAEDDALELARLRAEQEARERAEREAAEAAERERITKEAAERAAADQNRREELAAQSAREEEQRKAAEAIQRAESEKADAIAKAEAEKKALIEAQEMRERQQRELAEREAKEQAERDADRAHRSSVLKSAKEAIMSHGADEDTAKKIVLAIVANEIPNVSLRF